MEKQNISASAFELFLQRLVMEGFTPYYVTAGLCLIIMLLLPISIKAKVKLIATLLCLFLVLAVIAFGFLSWMMAGRVG